MSYIVGFCALLWGLDKSTRTAGFTTLWGQISIMLFLSNGLGFSPQPALWNTPLQAAVEKQEAMTLKNEIKIRGLSDADINIIDTMAKEKSMSRTAYLRWLIHAHASRYYVDEDKQNMAELLQKNERVLSAATVALDGFTKLLQRD